MTAKFYSRPIIPLLIFLIAGIIGGAVFPGYRTGFLAASALIVFQIFYCIVSKNADGISPLLLFMVLGYLSIQPWMTQDLPAHNVIHYTDTQKWRIVGTVDTHPLKYPNRIKFLLSVETLADVKAPIPVTGKIRVTVAGRNLELRQGDRISFSSKIRSIRNFNNPGGFNYNQFMAFRNVRGSSYCREEKIMLLESASGNSLSGRIVTARGHISKHIEKTGEGDHRDVLQALILGDRSRISPRLREAFHRSGIGHLLAISGLHIGIVASVAFVFFAWFLSRFEILLWKAWTRRGAAILSFLPVLVYALLAGMSPSTQRALIMVGLFLLTILLDRDHDLMNTLAVAAILILVVYPPALYTISFQLSFVAVFSIIYGISRIPRSTSTFPRRGKNRLFAKVATFFFVSLFATLGTLPLVMYYFNQVSLVGIFANFIFVPMIGFAVVPLGLLAVFLLPINTLISSWLMQIAAYILQMALKWVTLISDIPAAAVKTITPSILEICCYYLLVWSILNLIPFRSHTDEDDTAALETETGIVASSDRVLRSTIKRLFGRRLAGFGLICVLLVLAVDLGYWAYQRFWRSDLRVTILDVGQGSAALLELPGGYCIMADGGGFSNNAVFDVGARVVAPYLWRKKIRTIETLILSHPNSDHLNGLIYIAKHFHVKNVWTNDESRKTMGYRLFMEIVGKENIFRPPYPAIPRQSEINGVKLTIFYPPSDFSERKKIDYWRRKANNNSLVFKAALGDISFLFTGDIMAKAEKELIKDAGRKLKSTVLVLPHHGSQSSNTPQFIDAVQPHIGVTSTGWNNRFNFPHLSVLNRYRRRGINLFQTDRHGAITLLTDGKQLKVKCYLLQNG